MRYKILDQKGVNFLTFTIVEWIDLFTRPVYADLFIDSLKHCQAEKGLVIYAYVIMPSHVHLILQAADELVLSNLIQSVKSYTAKQFIGYIQDKDSRESRREWLLNHFAFNARKNRTRSEHQVWERDSHPVLIYSPQVIQQKLNYIHYNPVKARIVRLPEHYVYSSASNYETGEGVLQVTKLEDIWDDIGYVDLGGA